MVMSLVRCWRGYRKRGEGISVRREIVNPSCLAGCDARAICTTIGWSRFGRSEFFPQVRMHDLSRSPRKCDPARYANPHIENLHLKCTAGGQNLRSGGLKFGIRYYGRKAGSWNRLRKIDPTAATSEMRRIGKFCNCCRFVNSDHQ